MMKGLNEIALVVAVAALPFAANAQLKVLDDAAMGNLTGQAGVTLELQTRIDIAEVKYTDEGSLSLQNVSIGGANKTSYFGINSWGIDANNLLDNVKIDIDIAADGDAIINFGPINFSPIDFQVSIAKGELQGTTDSTTLFSNLNLVGLAGAGSFRVNTADDTLNFVTSLAIDDLDVDLDFLAVGLRDVQITGDTFDQSAPQPLRVFFNADGKLYSTANTRAASGQALALDLATINMDMRVGAVEIGGTSIGSLFLDNIAISNTHLEIYGH